MKTTARDKQNDLVLKKLYGRDGKVTYDIDFVTGAKAIRNVVAARTLTQKGELPLNKNRGLPYLNGVLGSISQDAVIDWAARVQETLRSTPGVKSVKSFSYNLVKNGKKRHLDYKATIETDEGEIVDLGAD